MNNRFVLIVLALFALFGSAFAQGPMGKMTPEQKAQLSKMREARYKQAAKDLKLTPDQIKKMRAADDKIQAKAMKIMEGPGDQQSKMPKLMGMRAELLAEYKKFLKPDQYKKVEEMMNQQMGGMGRGGAPKGKG